MISSATPWSRWPTWSACPPEPGRAGRPRRPPAGSGLVEPDQLLGAELQLRRLGRVGDGLGPAGAGDRDDHRGLGQHPGQRDLLRGHAVGVGDRLEGGMPGTERSGPAAPAERAPGQERDAQPRAVLQLALAGPERRRELVLHAGQAALAQDRAREVDLLDGRVGDPGQPPPCPRRAAPSAPRWTPRTEPAGRAGGTGTGRWRRRPGPSATPPRPGAGGRASRPRVQVPSPGRRWPPLVATSTWLVSPP